MNAMNMAASSAVKMSNFDASRLSSMIKSRNARFEIDLSNHTLIEVLEAHQMFKNKSRAEHLRQYTNSSVRASFSDLQDLIGDSIMPIDVSDSFWKEYIRFMSSGHTPSTIENYIQVTISALRWGARHGARIGETFSDYKIGTYSKTKVVLTPSQISHIYNYKIDMEIVNRIKRDRNVYVSKEFLEKVKDQFVLDCNIGQRFSDAKKLSIDNFDDTCTIYKVTQQKTGGKATVYLPKYAIDRSITYRILKKYGYKAPTYGCDINNFNKYLHILLQAIGDEFDDEVITENKINGEIVRETVPMWKAITSHTARRTFVSYQLSHGSSIAHIQKCTGHKDVRSLQCYTILADDE